MDPITLLFSASFAAIFIFALGLDIGYKVGRDITTARYAPKLKLQVRKEQVGGKSGAAG